VQATAALGQALWFPILYRKGKRLGGRVDHSLQFPYTGTADRKVHQANEESTVYRAVN